MIVEVLPDVSPELMESADWYELEREGLGADLLVEVDRGIDRIGEGPFRYPVVYRNIRRLQVDRFPFGIFFLIRDDRAIEFAITHLSRDSATWQMHIPLR
jgi:toxin ParE1/3/4